MGVSGNEPNGRAVQTTQLIIISIGAEFCALRNYREFCFEFISVLELHIFFFREEHFCLKTEIPDGVIFLEVEN